MLFIAIFSVLLLLCFYCVRLRWDKITRTVFCILPTLSAALPWREKNYVERKRETAVTSRIELKGGRKKKKNARNLCVCGSLRNDRNVPSAGEMTRSRPYNTEHLRTISSYINGEHRGWLPVPRWMSICLSYWKSLSSPDRSVYFFLPPFISLELLCNCWASKV